jgi:hypothetical protein
VVTVSHEHAPVYRPREPRASPLYRLIERYYPEFERVYDERYERRFGRWRPVIGQVCRRFLRCGDLHFGFARVRCTGCRHEMFVPFSCRQRCVCPSCHQKRSLLTHRRRGIRAKQGSDTFLRCEKKVSDPLGTAGDCPDFCGVGGAKMGLSPSPRAGSLSTWAMPLKRVFEVDPKENAKENRSELYFK